MAPFMTWLVPASGPERDRLAATIDKLAVEHGGPRFQPHVTVVATFDSAKDVAAQTLSSLVAGVPPVELTLVTIGHEQTYFRSLYLSAAPSAQLQELQRAGERAWGLAPLPHVPHLSLLYSDMTEERKRPIIGGLDIALPLTVRFDAVELWVRERQGVRSWYRAVQVPLPGPP
jgi:2'-5' RNA ligase